MVNTDIESLKALAKQAKLRMLTPNVQKQAGSVGAKEACISEREDRLYQKVVEMIESNEIIYNPLARLSVNDKFAVSDDGLKQKYVLELAELYLRLKNRYYDNIKKC